MRQIILTCSILLMICLSVLVGHAQDSAVIIENLQPLSAANAGSIQNIATFQVQDEYLTVPDPTGKMLLVVTVSGPEQKWGYVLWDIEAGMPSGSIDPGFYTGGVFSPDGKLFAIRNNTDQTVELHDAKTAQSLQIFTVPNGTNFGAFSPDSTTLGIVGYDGGTVRFWNISTGLEVGAIHHERVGGVAYHPHKPLVATVGFDGAVRLWNSDTYTLQSEITIPDINFNMIGNFVFNQSGDHLMLQSTKIRVWDTETGTPEYESHRLVDFSGSPYAPGNILGIRDDESLGFVNMDSGEQISSFSADVTQQIGSPESISPDGTLLLSLGSGGVLLWDVKTGDLLATLPHLATSSIAFSPTSQYIVTASGDGLIRLWGVAAPQ